MLQERLTSGSVPGEKIFASVYQPLFVKCTYPRGGCEMTVFAATRVAPPDFFLSELQAPNLTLLRRCGAQPVCLTRGRVQQLPVADEDAEPAIPQVWLSLLL